MGSESNKIDLTLKLCPCGESEKAEERKLKRTASSLVGKEMGGENNGAQWGPYVMPCLDRSCSLPSEEKKKEKEKMVGLVRFGDLQTMRRSETARRMLLERQRRVSGIVNEGNIINIFFFLFFYLFLHLLLH